MKSYRVSLAIVYLLCFYTLAGSGRGFWRRHYSDAIWWSTPPDVRLGYDAMGFFYIVLALAVIVGLTLRREWARTFAIVLGVLTLFVHLGMRIAGAYFADISVASMLKLFTLESWGVSLLAVITIIALTRSTFKKCYSEPMRGKQVWGR